MARKLFLAWLAMLLFQAPAVAQDASPDPFAIATPDSFDSIATDMSGAFTDPFWREACAADMGGMDMGEFQQMLCPAAPPPATPTRPAAPPRPLPRMMSPFPIVRIAGIVTRAGTKVALFAVRAPIGSRVVVRCRGRGCPVKRVEKIARRRRVRFRAFERLMPPGVVLEVTVYGAGTIGKFTRIKLRDYRRPARRDGCLWPGATRMGPCPVA